MPRWSWGLLQASDLLTPLVPGRTHPRPCPVVALPPLNLLLEDLQNREGGFPLTDVAVTGVL